MPKSAFPLIHAEQTEMISQLTVIVLAKPNPSGLVSLGFLDGEFCVTIHHECHGEAGESVWDGISAVGPGPCPDFCSLLCRPGIICF